MNTTLTTQIEVIQEMRRTVKVMVELGLLGTDNATRVDAALNDAGSSLVALNLSDPYKEIERLNNELLSCSMTITDLTNEIRRQEIALIAETEKRKEAEKQLTHYADVNQNQ